jgi:hypothetical protein
MPDLIDSPSGITLDEDLLGGFGGFPDRVFLLQVGEGKFAANNATLPDGQVVDGLACFPTPDDAMVYTGLLGGLNGEVVGKKFEEAREIAISKPKLSCLLLFVNGAIVDVHHVR